MKTTSTARSLFYPTQIGKYKFLFCKETKLVKSLNESNKEIITYNKFIENCKTYVCSSFKPQFSREQLEEFILENTNNQCL